MDQALRAPYLVMVMGRDGRRRRRVVAGGAGHGGRRRRRQQEDRQRRREEHHRRALARHDDGRRNGWVGGEMEIGDAAAAVLVGFDFDGERAEMVGEWTDGLAWAGYLKAGLPCRRSGSGARLVSTSTWRRTGTSRARRGPGTLTDPRIPPPPATDGLDVTSCCVAACTSRSACRAVPCAGRPLLAAVLYCNARLTGDLACMAVAGWVSVCHQERSTVQVKLVATFDFSRFCRVVENQERSERIFVTYAQQTWGGLFFSYYCSFMVVYVCSTHSKHGSFCSSTYG